MAPKCRRLIPRLEECENRVVPSTTTPHLALNYVPQAENHAQMAALDSVAVEGADRALVVTSGPNQVGPPFRVRSWARQHASAAAVNPVHIGLTLLTRSWPEPPAPTVSGEPIEVGPTFTTKG
jgi:hypothetical protein